jgi:hypothetical protein
VKTNTAPSGGTAVRAVPRPDDRGDFLRDSSAFRRNFAGSLSGEATAANAGSKSLLVQKDYEVVNGRITSPGKFAGEALYVPYFWDCYLKGQAKADADGVVRFAITSEERKAYPELGGKRVIGLRERDDGSICEG